MDRAICVCCDHLPGTVRPPTRRKLQARGASSRPVIRFASYNERPGTANNAVVLDDRIRVVKLHCSCRAWSGTTSLLQLACLTSDNFRTHRRDLAARSLADRAIQVLDGIRSRALHCGWRHSDKPVAAAPGPHDTHRAEKRIARSSTTASAQLG